MAKSYLLCLGMVLSLWHSIQAQGYNSVRMAGIQIGDPAIQIPTGFLIRAKAAGYNYIVAEFVASPTDEWSNGDYVGNGTRFSFRDNLRNAFIRTNQYGMRLIPLFQMGNNHSGWWRNINSNIHWEELTPGVPSDMPVMAPDANGMDRTLKSLITVIRDAFNQAALPYSLNYIHLGHDECYCDNCPTGTSKLLVGQSTLDKNWMSSHPGNSTNTSAQLLMADEIARTVTAVRAILPNTKVILHGDMYDPEANGTLFNTTNVLKAPAVQASSIRSNVIFVPWMYVQIWRGKDYNSLAAFNNFANNGFKFIYGMSVTDGNSPITSGALFQLGEYTATANLPKFRSTMAGFAAWNWLSSTTGGAWNSSNPIYQQANSWKTIEYASHVGYYGAPWNY